MDGVDGRARYDSGMMLSELDVSGVTSFSSAAARERSLREACAAGGNAARFVEVGRSEADRPIIGAVVGRGPRRCSLIAGSHADEPVGPETLRRLSEALGEPGSAETASGDTSAPEWPAAAERLLETWTFVIVPHVNPDGEAANRSWIDRWPDALAYLTEVQREAPGRDIEFGYPHAKRDWGPLREENRAVAAFLRAHGPYDLHVSLHGMSVAEGGWLLIERGWVDRTERLRDGYRQALQASGLGLFDWDRGGEKGFEYIGPGFATTPRADAMQAHFRGLGDEQTAAKFHASSMEFVQSLGGDPLCLVTELPLFLIEGEAGEREPGVPAAYLAFRELLPELRRLVSEGEIDAAMELVEPFSIRPVELPTMIGLQLKAIELGLESAASDGPPAAGGG